MNNLKIQKLLKGSAKETFNKFSITNFINESEDNNKKLYESMFDFVYENNTNFLGAMHYLNFLKETVSSNRMLETMLEIGMPHLINANETAFAHSMRRIELDEKDLNTYIGIIQNHGLPESKMPRNEQVEFAKNAHRKFPDEEYFTRFLDKREPEKNEFFIQTLAEMIAIDKKKAFKHLVVMGRQIESQLLLTDFFEAEIIQMLLEIAQETESFATYDYVWFWMRIRKETASKHLLMAKLCWLIFKTEFTPSGFFDGTKELNFFHIYRAAELEPENIAIQEQLLNLYEPGNESFDIDETKVLVQKVLKMNPGSSEALRVQKLLF
jgi:hypothetical protein